MFRKKLGRRAFVLATMLALIPIALIIMGTLTTQLFRESGMTITTQRKTKAFYLAQSGLTAAYTLFSWNVYRGHTHESDGTTLTSKAPGSDFLEQFGFPGHSLDSDGYYRWEWNPGQPLNQSFFRSHGAEMYRFKVYLPTPSTFVLYCEAQVDGQTSRQQIGGVLDNPFGYVTFDNGDCNDYTLAEDIKLTGKLHANGDLFVRPMKTEGYQIALNIPSTVVTLAAGLPSTKFLNLVNKANADYQFDVQSLTSSKKIYRHRDIHGEPDTGGTLMIASSTSSPPLSATEMPGGVKGVAFDSDNPDWRPGQPSPSQTDAVTRYHGVVADQNLGSKRRDITFAKAFESGGYYDTQAKLKITSTTASSTWCAPLKFFNQNENREVTGKEIDVAGLVASGDFPSNGIIYSDVPVRLVNGANVDKKLTVASSSTIYTKGDFNKGASQSVALMTTDRVYHLTSSFKDDASYNNPFIDPKKLQADLNSLTGKSIPDQITLLKDLEKKLKALDPAQDSDSELEVNAAIVDGAPADDLAAWKSGSSYNSGQGLMRDDGTYTGVRKVQFPVADDRLHFAYAQGGDYLENLQSLKLKFKGPRVHMQTAKMAAIDNSNLSSDPHLTPWAVQTCYLPAKERKFEADPKLALPGQEPPGALRACRRLYWKTL
jgi:hypothetical protein